MQYNVFLPVSVVFRNRTDTFLPIGDIDATFVVISQLNILMEPK
jgi:hypothetical protein